MTSSQKDAFLGASRSIATRDCRHFFFAAALTNGIVDACFIHATTSFSFSSFKVISSTPSIALPIATGASGTYPFIFPGSCRASKMSVT